MNRTAFLTLSSFALVACSTGASSSSATAPAPSSEVTVTATPTPSATAAAPPTQLPSSAASAPASASASAPPATSGPEGAWSSPSCDARKYERQLTLSADGTFASQDLVSPCPPNVACVWSGIVVRKGTWKLVGSALTLSTTDQQKQGAPLATQLRFEAGVLSEFAGSPKGCPYSRR